MSFITSIVNIKAKKYLWLKKKSRKMCGYAIKRLSPYTQKSVVVLGRQEKANHLIGETNTALAKRSTAMNLCVCMSVHLYLRQLWKSKDPEVTCGWTVCEILEGAFLCLLVCQCVSKRGPVAETVVGLQLRGTMHIPDGEAGKQEQLLGRSSV